MERQAELERAAAERGIERNRTAVEKAISGGRASETFAGIEMLKRAVEPAARAIANYMVEVEARGPRRTPALFRLCAHLDPYLLAYLTGKAILDRSLHNMTLLRTVFAIGAYVEDEMRHAAIIEQQPGLYLAIKRSMAQRGSSAPHARLVWSRKAEEKEIDIPRWTRNELVQVGTTLFDLFAEATGLVERKLVWVRENTSQWMVHPTPDAMKWFTDHNERAGLLRPSFMPTVIPPRPWSGLSGGGYHTDALHPLPLVKRTRPEHIMTLRHADMRVVYGGLNAIQETGWKINDPVRRVMQQVWDSGAELPCLPQKEDRPLPPRPFDIDTNFEARLAWKVETRQTHELNIKSRSQRLEIARLLTLGEELTQDHRIYFPHQLDFRGRCYAVPVGLNPQGPDEAKALLTFADAKPVNEKGAEWLLIHGANVFGYDKASLTDRCSWGMTNINRALATAEDPMRDLWWTEADNPWSFLAWCFEMQRVVQFDRMSSLPIALDGSCNGLQHFSAMLRDPVGGAAVNLLPSSTPQDIYQRVADRALERLVQAAHDGDWIARGWVDFGIDRKITKRPVMVLPYGGTRRACLKYVRDAVREKIRTGQENPFGDQLVKAEVRLADVVWNAIGDVVVAARKAMGWLQVVAGVATMSGIPLSWTTPSGFVAHQEYLDRERRLIKTRSRGQTVRLVDDMDLTTLNARQQRLGISPNFVHSMDAAAMMLTIRDAQAQGITQFAMIHDSYGTVAADTETLATSIRRAFVKMYDDHDVLMEFHNEVAGRLPDGVTIPLPPSKGDLDIHAVQDSAYFFA